VASFSSCRLRASDELRKYLMTPDYKYLSNISTYHRLTRLFVTSLVVACILAANTIPSELSVAHRDNELTFGDEDAPSSMLLSDQ
jgi:hypothetical protein